MNITVTKDQAEVFQKNKNELLKAMKFAIRKIKEDTGVGVTVHNLEVKSIKGDTRGQASVLGINIDLNKIEKEEASVNSIIFHEVGHIFESSYRSLKGYKSRKTINNFTKEIRDGYMTKGDFEEREWEYMKSGSEIIARMMESYLLCKYNEKEYKKESEKNEKWYFGEEISQRIKELNVL